MTIGRRIIDFIIENGLVRAESRSVSVWKEDSETKLNRLLEEWSLPRKINSIKEGSPIVIFTDDYKKTMREIEACKKRQQVSKYIKTKKARVIIDDEIKIGVYVYLEVSDG